MNFLAKYFEEDFKSTEGFNPLKIILVAPPFKDDEKEVIWTFNFINTNFKNLSKIQHRITILGSKDDFVVPFDDIKDYMKFLPEVKYVLSEDYGHYLWEEVPEIIEEIKK